MLLLTDRVHSTTVQAIATLLAPVCTIVPLHHAPAGTWRASLIVIDADLTKTSTFSAIASFISRSRSTSRTPVIFLLRSVGDEAAAKSQGATATIQDSLAPAFLSDYVNRSRIQASTIQIATVKDAASIESGLRSMMLSMRTRAALPLAEIETATHALLYALKSMNIRSWLSFIQQYDDLTYRHSLTVAGFAATFAMKLRLTPKSQHMIAQAALVHDIGKSAVPPQITNKAGPLTAGEMEVMRTHPIVGYEMLTRQGGVPPVVLDIVRHHHEMLDGSGYPDGLKARGISEFVRMVTVCDIFAALTERRPYRPPMAPDKALAIMDGMVGRLDQAVLLSFTKMVAGDLLHADLAA